MSEKPVFGEPERVEVRLDDGGKYRITSAGSAIITEKEPEE